MAAIEVRRLRKTYGPIVAVDDLSFDVRAGEVYALLGHNGAGKSTTVEILEGHRDRTAGEVSVLGTDPRAGGRELRDRIGIVLQSSGIEGELYVGEALELHGSCYRRRRDVADVLELVGLTPQAGQRIGTCRAGNAAGSTSPSASSDGPSCCSSTSRRPASIPPPAAGRGS